MSLPQWLTGPRTRSEHLWGIVFSLIASAAIIVGLGLAFGWDAPLYGALAASSLMMIAFSRVLPWRRFERENRP